MQEKNAKNNRSGNGKAPCKPEDANSGIDNKEDKITVSRKEYEALKSKAQERDVFYDQYVRAHAEFDNARKRLEKERSDALKYANESMLLDFLPIIDNLEIAEKHIKEAKDFKAVQEGVDMIQVQIQQFLKDIGIERVKALGERFDPHLHDPVEIEETKDGEDGIVIGELKPGYRFNGRLLRPASVKIVKRKD